MSTILPFGPVRLGPALRGVAMLRVSSARAHPARHLLLFSDPDLDLGGRARDAKGSGSIEATLDLLLDLLARSRGGDAPR